MALEFRQRGMKSNEATREGSVGVKNRTHLFPFFSLPPSPTGWPTPQWSQLRYSWLGSGAQLPRRLIHWLRGLGLSLPYRPPPVAAGRPQQNRPWGRLLCCTGWVLSPSLICTCRGCLLGWALQQALPCPTGEREAYCICRGHRAGRVILL